MAQHDNKLYLLLFYKSSVNRIRQLVIRFSTMSINKPSMLPIPKATESPPIFKDLNQSVVSQSNYANPPLTYTYYQPTHTQSAVTLPNHKQPQRKEYRYVTQSFTSSNLPAYKAEFDRAQKQEKNEISLKRYAYKTIGSSLIETPQTKTKDQGFIYSANPMPNPYNSARELKCYPKIQIQKSSNFAQPNTLSNSNMFESTILEQKQANFDKKQTQQKLQANNQNQQLFKRSGNNQQPRINQFELTYEEMVKKPQKDEFKEKQLQGTNFSMAQELLSNQTLIRSHQQKIEVLIRQKNEFSQKYKKSEQSLKISRNIIVTLNQKLARNLKQTEANFKSAQQKYQNQILQMQHYHQLTVKRLQSSIFELKLKVIDQTNSMQQALAKAEQQFKLAGWQRQSILRELSDTKNAKQLKQSQLRKVNQVLANLQNNLIKIDQENMSMDKQIGRLLQVNAQNESNLSIVQALNLQNQQLKTHIFQINLFVEQLKLQNIHLTQYQTLNSNLLEQRANQAEKMKAQLQISKSLVTTVKQLQCENQQLRSSIQSYKQQIAILSCQKQEFLKKMEQKDGQIANLNIIKGNLVLQNLKKIQMLKRIQSLQRIITQQKVTIDEMRQLKSQISLMSKQIDYYKIQIQQKQAVLIQKANNQLVLSKEIKERVEEIQGLNCFLLNKELQQTRILRESQYYKASHYLQNPTKLWQTEFKYVKFQKFQLEQWKNNYLQLKRQFLCTKQKNLDLDLQTTKLLSTLQQKKDHITQLKNQLNTKVNQSQRLQIIKRDNLDLQNKRYEQVNFKIQELVQQLGRSEGYIQQQTNQTVELKQQLSHSLQSQQRIRLINIQLEQKLAEENRKFEEQLALQKETIEQRNIQINQLQSQTLCQRQSYELILIQISEAKQIANKLRKQKTTLEEQLKTSKQMIEQQKATIDQLNLELQTQQNDYRIMVEQQIGKITKIYSEEAGLSKELDSPLRPKSKSLVSKEPQIISQNSPEKFSRSYSQRQLQKLNRAELIEKVLQLQFANRNLQAKIQDICNMQENLNEVIIDKLKTFEVNLEKNDHQKHELELRVVQLTQELEMVSQKCQHYERKIEWIDNMYKEVQSNLNDTIEELIRAQALYYNLKFEVDNQKGDQQGKLVESNQNQNVQIQGQNQQMNFLSMIKGAETYADFISSKQKEHEQRPYLIQEVDPLEDQEFADYEIEQGILNYYVKSTQCGERLYQIKISHVDSQSQEEEFQNQQEFAQEIDILQQWMEQVQQIDQRMYKKEQTKRQEMQEAEPANQVSDFIMRTIGRLEEKDKKDKKSAIGSNQPKNHNQMSNYDQRIYKKEQTKRQEMQEAEPANQVSDFIMRTIGRLEEKEKKDKKSAIGSNQPKNQRKEAIVEPQNQFSNYLMNMIKKLEQKQKKSAFDDAQILQEQKYEGQLSSNLQHEPFYNCQKNSESEQDV